MIASIRINGFQSHVDTHIDFARGLNVITGPSDAGKTAIIRAVRWVAFGEPSGEAFVNATVGEAEVKITLENGVSITKRRRRGKTSYELSTIPEPFEKAEVPEEVKQALGIMKQTFGDFETSLNFAFQLDSPFLISETASAGAKILGKIAGTELVDLATRAVSKDTHAARAERTQAEKEIQKIDAQLVEYLDLDGQKQQLKACEYVMSQIDEHAKRGERLTGLSQQYGRQQEVIGERRQRLVYLDLVPYLIESLEDVEKAQQRRERLLDLKRRYNEVTSTVTTLTARLVQLQDVQTLSDKLERLGESQVKLSRLNSLSKAYQKYIDDSNKALDTLEKTKDLDQLVGDLASIEAAVSRADRLLRLAKKNTDLFIKFAGIAVRLEALKGLPDARQAFESLGPLIDRREMLKSYSNQLTLRTITVTQAEKRRQTASDLHTAAERDLQDLWATIDVCPLCENPIGGMQHGH